MPQGRCAFSRLRSPVVGLCALLAFAPIAAAQSTGPDAEQAQRIAELLSGVVRIKTFIDPDGRTSQNLGREREGSGIVLDHSGLILTIGYLMVEAHAAEVVTNDGRAVPANVVGYDHETGFGLLQSASPLKVRPIPIGKSADVKPQDTIIVASFGGVDAAMGALVMSKREFAGSWEYLLDEAIFTSPPHPAWSGAALMSLEGKLVGVGSLLVNDAMGSPEKLPGNMFVPIDRLPPILSDLMASGRVGGVAKPWLGVNTEEVEGQLKITRVSPNGPAEKAGIQGGDIIAGVNGETPKSLPEFYRKVWAMGRAGVLVPLEVKREQQTLRFEVKSMNRMDHLKLKSTF